MSLVLVGTLFLGALFFIIIFIGPRKFAFLLLETYRQFNLLYLRLTGQTAGSLSERRVISGQAWDEWTLAIRAAGAALSTAGCPMDPLNQAEGYRYLSRLVRASLESFVECNDPAAPVLVAIADGNRAAPIKLGADNPDNLYQSANLDGTHTYRVWGKRGTVNYLGFGTQSGMYGGPGGLKTVMYKEAGLEFDVGKDGSFELILSADPPSPNNDERNWLRLERDPPRAMLIVRQTFLDRGNETPAEIHVQRTSAPHSPSPFTCAQLEEGLRTSAMFVAGASFMFARWSHGFQAHMNQLPLYDQEASNKAGGDPQIRYFHGYWRLGPNEALVIEANPPPCAFWNFQLNNHWMESLDYRYFTVHVNKHTAKYFPEKEEGKPTVRVIVAHQDPKLDGITYNWINTCNHNQGQMLWRWVRVDTSFDGSNLPHPRPRVINVADLQTSLQRVEAQHF